MSKKSISRRSFLNKAATLGTVGAVVPSILNPEFEPNEEKQMDNKLPAEVQLQFMRPQQLEDALRKFPVVYVPFGLIEWHGRHLPLGNDTLKAHIVLVKCAEKFGGVVYPPIYYPYATYSKDKTVFMPEDELKVNILSGLFNRIKAMGTRVIIGVSGHNVMQQNMMIEKALEPVVADGTVKGIGIQEITLSRSDESSSDHAAKWETSNMMYFYPELVDLSALGTGPLAPDMKPPDGISGLDPRQYASAEIGRRNVELASAAIGKKAKELLESLPENNRSFNKPCICPGSWWSV